MTNEKVASSRRVIRGTKNVFADLGFPDAGVRQVKLRLAYCVAGSLDNRKLSNAAAAKVLGVSTTTVRAIRSYKLHAFSIERLMTLVTALGHDIEIVVRRPRRSRKAGRLHVGGAEAERTAYLNGADRDKLDPILDVCVAVYKEQLDEDGQVDFKGKAKAFLRAYGFLSSILPYTNADWEKLSIFLNFLVSKLPAPKEEDLSKGILEAIDMDSYRVEKKAAVKIQLPDSDAEIEPVPTTGGGHKPEPELERLSNILKVFNDQFGNIPWTDADRVHKLITEDIPNRVAADKAYQNAKQNSDKQNARIEHDKALARVMTAVLKDDTELFKQFMDNESFRRWLTDTVFGMTYERPSV
jgi:predicted XRE-type DNA-binding protein